MPIEISNSRVIPEHNFNKVFVLGFNLNQPQAQSPVYNVHIHYILYAEMPDGTKVFDVESERTIDIEDYEEKALADLSNNDPRLMEALVGFEQSLALLLEKFDPSLGETTAINPMQPE